MARTVQHETAWLPEVQHGSAESPWTGEVRFEAFPDSWFWPHLNLTLVVGKADVEIRSGCSIHGKTSRDELRHWFTEGTVEFVMGSIVWVARPMGVALLVAGSPPYRVESEAAAFIAERL